MKQRSFAGREFIQEIAFASPWSRTIQGVALLFLAVMTMHTIEDRIILEKTIMKAFGA